MHKNNQGQDVRDAVETDAWVRDALRDAHTEDEFIERAKAAGVPGFVAKRRFRELEQSGELERVGDRMRAKGGRP
ncbi:MAG TPA: hypothetical protein VGK73_27990 [Polyangiaceae bacterium]